MIYLVKTIKNYLSHNILNNLNSKVFFYILVLLIPISTRKIFFTEFSFYYQYHSFYNSLFIYLTDVVFFVLIITWIIETYLKSSKNTQNLGLFNKISTKFHKNKDYKILILFWLVLALSMIFSREILLSSAKILRFSEYLLIYLYIKEKIDFSREIYKIFWVFGISLGFQAILALFQYIKQSSLGLGLLGEEFLRSGLPGIAEFVSREIINPFIYTIWPYLSPFSEYLENIRAYGTLPHPNILAALLFVGFLSSIYLLYVSREKFSVFLSICLIFVISSGLVVTFSRSAWFVAIIGIITWFLIFHVKIGRLEIKAMRTGNLDGAKRNYKPGRMLIILAVFLVSLGINWFLFGGAIGDRLNLEYRMSNIEYGETESIEQRALFNHTAFAMIKQNPVLGVGVGNFVVAMDGFSGEKLLPHEHQPAHNLYLLIASEAGILALVIFIIFLLYIVRHSIGNMNPGSYILLIILAGFLLLGMVDHYFWSNHSAMIMFWVVLGLLARATKKQPFQLD